MMAVIRHRADSPPPKKKQNAESQQKSKNSHAAIDPLVNPGSPPNRYQARPKADPTRTYHRMALWRRAHQAAAQRSHFKANRQL
jgi:hypothetical protein